MDIFLENNIKSILLKILSDGPAKATDLVEKTGKARKGTTKQGTYKALRSLLRDRIIVKYKKKVMLNLLWLDKLNEFTKKSDNNYHPADKNQKHFENLDWMKNRDKIIYNFNDFYTQDIFYSHLFSSMIKKTDSQSPVYVYNPHEWLFLDEKSRESEKYLIEWAKKEGRQFYFTIGRKSILDKKFRDENTCNKFQIDLNEQINFPENCFINVIGNFIAETIFDKQMAKKINAVYKNTKAEEEASQKIAKIMKKQYRVKIILSRNSQKAAKLKSKLGKNFFIPKELRNL